jgi:hypothetical protein
MIPCNFCSRKFRNGERCLFDANGNTLKDLKLVGKTKYKSDGISFERVYKCRDCGTSWRMIGRLGINPSYCEVPLLRVVDK